MKPGDFDHERAWREWAKPRFDALPADVRQIYFDIRDHYGFLHQQHNLDVRWPTDEEEGMVAAKTGSYDPLRRRFDNVPAEWLATAIPRVYGLGHWFPGPNEDGGAYWKFENLAKQVLIAKGREYCTWDDHKCPTQDFIVLSPAEIAIDAALKDTGVSRHSIKHVNHRPHPFVIGEQHFPTDGGMYIRPEQAPCAMRGCDLSYEQHESDHVLFLVCPGEGENVELTDEQKKAVQSLGPILEEHGLDGVAFVRE